MPKKNYDPEYFDKDDDNLSINDDEKYDIDEDFEEGGDSDDF